MSFGQPHIANPAIVDGGGDFPLSEKIMPWLWIEEKKT